MKRWATAVIETISFSQPSASNDAPDGTWCWKVIASKALQQEDTAATRRASVYCKPAEKHEHVALGGNVLVL